MKKILILFGGKSYEHEISCRSVNFILENIDRTKFLYNIVGINLNNEWFELENQKIDLNWNNTSSKRITNIIDYCKKFDIVFPIIHGNTFEDGKLQSIFELNNIKYVGCNSYSSLICYDKFLTKLILEKHDIPQVPYYIYKKSMDYKNIKYPVIVKPAKCGSSIGINVCNNKKDLQKAIKIALKYDNNIIIEKYIKRKIELECALLQKGKKLIISDIGEIINDSNFYDFKSKYINNCNTKISDLNNDIKTLLKNYAKEIFYILGCKDLSRIDFLYDIDNNKIYFNEINTMPGFTNISMFPTLLNNIGIKYSEIINILLNC